MASLIPKKFNFPFLSTAFHSKFVFTFFFSFFTIQTIFPVVMYEEKGISIPPLLNLKAHLFSLLCNASLWPRFEILHNKFVANVTNEIIVPEINV